MDTKHIGLVLFNYTITLVAAITLAIVAIVIMSLIQNTPVYWDRLPPAIVIATALTALLELGRHIMGDD